MPEPTYSLPVTIRGIKMRGAFFPDEIPGDLRPLLNMAWARWTSEDGEGQSLTIWPHPSELYEPHRVTIAGITHCFWPWELADTSPKGREHLLRRLADELSSSRIRIENGHWVASQSDHFALMQCYNVELSLLLGPTRSPPD